MVDPGLGFGKRKKQNAILVRVHDVLEMRAVADVADEILRHTLVP